MGSPDSSNSSFTTRFSRSLIASAALALAMMVSGGTAYGADMLQEPFEAPEVETKPAGGWYLRGDISYTSHKIDEIYFGVYADPGNRHFNTAELEETMGVQGGIGYQINENFRVDATLGYKFTSDFTGSTSGSCAIPDGAGGTRFVACSSTDKTRMSATTILANAYVDLGKYAGFTPYVGGGIGGAYVSFDPLSNSINCVAGSVDNPCLGTGLTTEHPGEEGWRFAYALHVGASYDISARAKLDLGYSYERIEGGRMFGWPVGATAGTTNKAGPQGHDLGISDHTFRAGIRYDIW